MSFSREFDWAFTEAERVISNFSGKSKIRFATGYGPSGLPHIGTFGEVVRTMAIITACKLLDSSVCTELLAFSDDMDGLRKIPDNIPGAGALEDCIDMPLSSVPDPSGIYSNYASHMNSCFCEFLDSLEVQYRFCSATECYKSGIFNDAILDVLRKYDEIVDLILPTLGPERRANYSPILPICPDTGKILQVPLVDIDADHGIVSYFHNGKKVEICVLNGGCKLQWKVDWSMRWRVFDINYEMYGKDLHPSAVLSTKICEILGSRSPLLFRYELFVDAEGKKISKSKGNGLSVDFWLKYAFPESLAMYVLQNPQKSRKLAFDVIPRSMDLYLKRLSEYHHDRSSENPVVLIHFGSDRVPDLDISTINFSILMNLASACNTKSGEILLSFAKKYSSVKDENSFENEYLARMCNFAIQYYCDFILPHRNLRVPDQNERVQLLEFKSFLCSLGAEDEGCEDKVQNYMSDLGRKHFGNDAKQVFKMFYEVFLGTDSGPKVGSFVKLYGIKSMISLIDSVLDGNSN